jgi:hypothetical protein
VSAVEALDEAVVCEAVRMTGVSWWQHAGSWWGWSATASSRPARCPECGSNAAEELLLEHVGDAQAVLAATTCPSCGILHEATPGAVDVALVEHQDEFSGRTEVTVRLRAPQGVESAWIGAEVLASVYYDSRVTTEPVLVRFGEAGEAAYTFEVERDQDAPAADLVRVKIFCCAGARLSCRTLGLFARPEGVPAEGGVR